jgi:hypothetical protein
MRKAKKEKTQKMGIKIESNKYNIFTTIINENVSRLGKMVMSCFDIKKRGKVILEN